MSNNYTKVLASSQESSQKHALYNGALHFCNLTDYRLFSDSEIFALEPVLRVMERFERNTQQSVG